MRQFGLIGYPLSHSFSKGFFTEKFRKEKIEDAAYETYPLAVVSEFPLLMEKTPGLRGLNVTIPYKESIIPFLDELSETARAVGACNVIDIRDGRLSGHNTDVIGFRRSLEPVLPPGRIQALVLGTGGAAKAVSYVLRQLNISHRLVSRNPGPGKITYDEISPAIARETRLWVNTTPLGMQPDIGRFPPIPYEWLGPGYVLFDLIYNPDKTLFLLNGEEKGAVIKNGREMLEIQAEESWKIWNE